MYRIDAKDADALGLTTVGSHRKRPRPKKRAFSEKMVWDQLKTVYDPEIPVNIADLGLIYSCVITPLDQGGHRIDIQMSMTAPGCGMGNVLKIRRGEQALATAGREGSPTSKSCSNRRGVPRACPKQPNCNSAWIFRFR